MGAARVSSHQRFSRGATCPICGGSDGDKRHAGTRCHGFLSDDEDYAHCSREEHANGAPYSPESATYAHKLNGPCKCGVEHGPPKPRAANWKDAPKRIVAEYDYVDEAGELLFQALRYEDKSFRQRRPGPFGGTWIWSLKDVRRILYRLRELIAADPSRPVLVAEGEKDCDNLRSKGLVATCNPMGAKKWRDEYAPFLAGRAVWIVPDHDEDGQAHAEQVARSVAKVARSVKVIDLAGLCRALGLGELAAKGDASDFLKMGGTAEQLVAAFEATSEYVAPKKGKTKADAPKEDERRFNVVADDPPPGDDRPAVICGFESPEEGLKTWTPAALDAMAKANRRHLAVFQRSKKLVRLSMATEDDCQPSIETLGLDALRGILDRVAYWGNVHKGKKGDQIKFGAPRIEIVKDILSLGSLDPDIFPPLELIAESPVFGADGTLILEPGYHRSARLFYSPSGDLKGIDIPESPTPGEVGAALELIFGELLVDFPFRNQASRANALAVMLLPFVRPMISGPTPNHHFTAPTEGTGKGKCATACAFPFLGREVEITGQKESEAEWRKAITSFLMSGASHYLIDNIRNPLGWDNVPQDIESGILAAAWTGTTWKDRILGGQEEARVKLNAVFMSTGNNVSFSRELTRRLVNIELLPASENPSLQTGFKHDPLEEWARQNRAALTRACLVLCRNWIARGKKPGGVTMGSYESYARTMGGILEGAGVKGFLENRPKVGSGKDRESVRWPALVEAWHKDRGGMATSAGQVYDLIFGDPGISGLRIAFADIVGDGKPLSRKQKFGRALSTQDGRVWGDWRIVRTGTRTADGTVLYRLVAPAEGEQDDQDDQGGVSGVSGVSETRSHATGAQAHECKSDHRQTPETPETPADDWTDPFGPVDPSKPRSLFPGRAIGGPPSDDDWGDA